MDAAGVRCRGKYDHRAQERGRRRDANFNVTALVNDSGPIVERYSYTPNGDQTVLDSDFTPDADNTSDYTWHNTFQGLRKDEVTGEYQARNRNLNSSTGMWTQRDPAGYVDGASLYQVGGSNLVTYSDPYGLCTKGDRRIVKYEVKLLPFGSTPKLDDAQDELIELAGTVDTLNTWVEIVQASVGKGADVFAKTESWAAAIKKAASEAADQVIADKVQSLIKVDPKELAAAGKRLDSV